MEKKKECTGGMNLKCKYPHLFSPIVLRGNVYKNRITSAPIGAWSFSPRNFIFDYALSMFEEKAIGGASAITIGHTEVNAGEEDADDFGLYFNLRNPEGSAALCEYVSAIKQHGSHASLQLNYGACGNGFSSKGLYYGPSERVREDGSIVREMDEDRIMMVIQQYVDAAKQLKKTGFDMVMIHGAHNWLPEQFMNPKMNRRTDKYGGSLENRMRFPLMLVKAVREAIGEDMVMEYRISAADPIENPEGHEEDVALINALEGIVDIVNVSSGSLTSQIDAVHTFPTYLEPRGLNIERAAALKKRVNIPIAVVGNITDPDMAEAIIAEGKADFVSMARGLMADPDFPTKAKHGHPEDIRPCIGCYNCLEVMHINHFVGCDVNPRTGREHRIGRIQPAINKKKVVVVGGGPAGMQAAIVSAERGHEVILFEKGNCLGGLLRVSDNDPTKGQLNKYMNYLITQVGKLAIDVRLNTEATPEMVEMEAADVVFVATGSTPIIPNIPGVDRDNVYDCISGHKAGDALGDKVVVVGGNMVGCETALYLSAIGKEATVIEMSGRLHADANNALGASIDVHIAADDRITTMTNTTCTQISDKGVHIKLADGSESILPADSVILAVGLKATTENILSMSSCAIDVIPVGDCIKPATVQQASRTAYYAALDI